MAEQAKVRWVLIHGAWAKSWVWDGVGAALRDHGHEVIAPDLPGSGAWDASEVSLDDVVDHVLAEAQSIELPTIVVGHSGGGVVATNVAERMAATGQAPAGVAYIAGMMQPSGMDFGQLCALAGLTQPVGIVAYTERTADNRGTFVPPEAAATIFFHCASADDAIKASRRLVPQLDTTLLITPAWTDENFGRIPRLYVEATLDRSVPIEAQRKMQELVPGAEVVTLETDHAPQLSALDDLVEQLLAFSARVAG